MRHPVRVMTDETQDLVGRVEIEGERRLPASGHRRTVTAASTSPHLVDLELPGLRAYRQQLRDEEEKISYWRRLVHARIDLLKAGSAAQGSLSLADVVRVLGDTGSGQTRTSLINVRAAEPLPDLPTLAEVWLVPEGDDEIAEALDHLAQTEVRLTEYRRALHARIDEATGELISRYRIDPTGALSALTA